MSGQVMDEIGQPETEELKLQKQEAFQRFSAVWEDALVAGIEPEMLAHVALFAALGDLVATYGESAVARFRRTAARAASRPANSRFRSRCTDLSDAVAARPRLATGSVARADAAKLSSPA